eukprot:6882173-Ditylum_brightwellii.AAC.1
MPGESAPGAPPSSSGCDGRRPGHQPARSPGLLTCPARSSSPGSRQLSWLSCWLNPVRRLP